MTPDNPDAQKISVARQSKSAAGNSGVAEPAPSKQATTKNLIQTTDLSVDPASPSAISETFVQTFKRASITNNAAWSQLLGLCPLLAVSSTLVNSIGLAIASLFVVVGSSISISALRHMIPNAARLPCFVLIIATFTTMTTMVLEAFAFELYLKIALFVQIIVTNCMILGRAEGFASRQPVFRAAVDALGTGLGFALALICLGSVREALGSGTIGADLSLLFGAAATDFEISLGQDALLPLAIYPPGAFIIGGLLLALANALIRIYTRFTSSSM